MVVIIIIIIIIIIFIIIIFRSVYSEYTEANSTSLLPLDTILLEICAFIVSFSCTVWTKMRSLAGSLADFVLADAILIPPHPPISVRYGVVNRVRKLKMLVSA